MKFVFYVAGLAAALLLPGASHAQNRYAEPPPVLVSPDLSAPWVMQLRQVPAEARPRTGQRRVYRAAPQPPQHHAAPRPAERRYLLRRQQQQAQPTVRTAAAPRAPSAPERALDPKFLPQEVAYDGSHAPGTIVVDTRQRFLYLVLKGGKARRYGVGVGKEGFGWSGTEKITSKREWPDWRPPAEMIAREKKKGRVLPTLVRGGPQNPLGARALYLGSTLYRIHGTNAPWTIGQAVSSGCIRMRNEDVIELYERVPVGTKVVVI
ncbi:L,D-transpeptidase [Chelativorans sp. AA-79]|uniref:L,D-transpeptidase n=1 Tax=Chelativorans sp. AA-79 TaxID=3028735 RepID=UPI0023F8930C|nr:L,D-transpeptidase [Chelativorans sp. AA-79]WEX08474.1 L,D-transpeptidase [Chelativorans sp. AA-79]